MKIDKDIKHLNNITNDECLHIIKKCIHTISINCYINKFSKYNFNKMNNLSIYYDKIEYYDN
jgi:hypothetical protein